MAKVLQRVRIANPGKRKMRKPPTPAQLRARAKFTAMVKARAKARRVGNPKSTTSAKGEYKLRSSRTRRFKKTSIGNPGEIITIGLNPGRVRNERRKKVTNMARRKKARRVRRAVSKVARRVSRRRRNPGMRRRVRRYYAKRRNSGVVARRKRYTRRRNPGMLGGFLSGTATNVFGLILGAAVTKKTVDFLPDTFKSGFLKYVSTAVVASVFGYGISRFARSPRLGSSVALGGYTLLGLQLMNDFIPGFAGYSAIGLRGGMGLIANSSFFTPQVPVGSSMTNFVPPAALMAAAVPAKVNGVGRVAPAYRTRMGR